MARDGWAASAPSRVSEAVGATTEAKSPTSIEHVAVAPARLVLKAFDAA